MGLQNGSLTLMNRLTGTAGLIKDCTSPGRPASGALSRPLEPRFTRCWDSANAHPSWSQSPHDSSMGHAQPRNSSPRPRWVGGGGRHGDPEWERFCPLPVSPPGGQNSSCLAVDESPAPARNRHCSYVTLSISVSC